MGGKHPLPPVANSAYLVTRHTWQGAPTPIAGLLYVGGNCIFKPRFRTRVGEVLIDAHGYCNGLKHGHSSGGQHLRDYCEERGISPRDLYIAWVEGIQCHRCLEVRLHEELHLELNKMKPTRCPLHNSGPPKHNKIGKGTKAGLRARIAELEAENAALSLGDDMIPNMLCSV